MRWRGVSASSSAFCANFYASLPVELVESNRLRLRSSSDAAAVSLTLQHHSAGQITEQDRAGDVRHWLCGKWLLANSGFDVLTQPVYRGGFIADHLPVDHPDFIGIGYPVAMVMTVAKQEFSGRFRWLRALSRSPRASEALHHQRQAPQLLLRLVG